MKIIINFVKKLLQKSKKKPYSIKSEYIIPRSKHCISKTNISPNALKVLNGLNRAKYQSYLVGGSVRDLLIHMEPKDFDVVTDATPNEIKKLFSNARIIGRRFKLVHILYHREVIEVATFRAKSDFIKKQEINEHGMIIRDNVFGALDEDVWRRDFSINALYYNIADSSIIDFTDGVKDIESKTIRIIGDPTSRYQEDPVRMLRAIRFAAKLNFNLAADTAEAIIKNNFLIKHVSPARLFDEMVKLFQCGNASYIKELLNKYGLVQHLFPSMTEELANKYPLDSFLEVALENTDSRIKDGRTVTPSFILAAFLWFPMLERSVKYQQDGLDPLPALEKSMSKTITEQNQSVFIPKRFSQVIREIWLLQFRFNKRFGKRPFSLIQHPRFRAAYDFFALRSLAGDESIELANWWTVFQDADEDKKIEMVKSIAKQNSKKRTKSKKIKAEENIQK